jgi:uncharacterized protein (DUF849 family)
MNNKGSTWLEVALNGPWSRERQPAIPIHADEIVEQAIACAHEGAAIIHLHPYDPATGRQRDDADIYAPIIERIRSKVDVICYGTLPFAGDVDATGSLNADQRYSAVEALARNGLLEWTVVDPGSTHITTQDDIKRGKEGFIYANPEDHVRRGLALCQQYRLTPSYAIYEPGFMRLGAALHRALGDVPQPVYRLMFSDHFTFGFPPQPWAVEAYARLLAVEAPGAAWMVAGLGVQIDSLIEHTVAHGGHVRVGLEDAPLGHTVSNVDQVRAARTRIERSGGRLASAAEVREATAS